MNPLYSTTLCDTISEGIVESEERTRVLAVLHAKSSEKQDVIVALIECINLHESCHAAVVKARSLNERFPPQKISF